MKTKSLKLKIKNLGKLLSVWLVGTAFLFYFSAGVLAADGALDLLKESAGPRPQAMGGAFTAIAGSIYSPGWNPAGIASISNIILGSSYASAYGEISRFGIFGTYPIFDGCAEVTALLEKTSDAPQTIVGSDGRPEVVGSFSDSQLVLALSYARPILMRGLSAGANLKYHNHSIASASGNGFSLDLGAIYYPMNSEKDNGPLLLGLTLRNPLTTKISWSTGSSDSFNREIVLGAAYSGQLLENNYIISGDFLYGSSKKISAGFEYWISRILPVRLGYSKDKSLTFGTGLKIGNGDFDLAYFSHSDLGAAYQFSFSWTL